MPNSCGIEHCTGPQHSDGDVQSNDELESVRQQALAPIEHEVPLLPQSMIGPAQVPAPSHNNVTSLFPGLDSVRVPQGVRLGFGWHIPVPAKQESLHAPVHAVPQQIPLTQ